MAITWSVSYKSGKEALLLTGSANGDSRTPSHVIVEMMFKIWNA